MCVEVSVSQGSGLELSGRSRGKLPRIERVAFTKSMGGEIRKRLARMNDSVRDGRVALHPTISDQSG
ncbi:MAG: hypothetical protein NVSMB9_07340 [Isosphaeraceae bacterium]